MGIFYPTHIRIPPGTPWTICQVSDAKKLHRTRQQNVNSLRCRYVVKLTILKRLTWRRSSVQINIVNYKIYKFIGRRFELLSVEP